MAGDERTPLPGKRARRWWWVVAVAVAAVVVVVVPLTSPVPPRPAQALTVGVALTQRAADPWNPRAATGRATEILGRVADAANQHIMGWGALNPAPAPGERDWASLDARMQLTPGPASNRS
ncbi:hypothetical protein BJF78_29415 [Pseudonocardia sp. CNS-139]|nr:hypothetical protein BJF78_29415 [Pseudonocardia sp. CNS-139]